MNAPKILPSTELKRILVVDDEQLIVEALQATLRQEGYEVIGTVDPLEALRQVQNTPFAVVLTDQQMPGLTGLDLLARVKELQPDATRLLITAILSLGTVIDAINQGEVYRFIVKPWLREELVVTIHNAVQRYALIRRNTALHAQAVGMNELLAVQIEQLDTQNRKLDQLNQALHQNLDRSVQLCLKTLETFCPPLGVQARRALAICQAMAEGLNLSPEQRQVLEISSRLHDIGMVGVPREVIRKWQENPDNLTDQERVIVELHPVLGQHLAEFVADLEAVGTTIRAHHERFDGEGYPDRLREDEIPWLARLLAVAVAYASHPQTEQTALEYVKVRSGTVFDPDAVRAFLRCLPRAAIPRSQRAVLISELKPGMVVAASICTAYGILLIPEGQALTGSYIDLLRNHNRISPIAQSLFVYC